MERYNKLKGSKYYPPLPPGPIPRELVDIGLARAPESELESLRSKGLVKGRKSEDGQFVPVLPDTPPPNPIRDDYFPPLPVDLADDSFALPDVLTKPLILPKPVLDNFSRLITKIIDSKKKKYKLFQKNRRLKILTILTYQSDCLNVFLRLITSLMKKWRMKRGKWIWKI